MDYNRLDAIATAGSIARKGYGTSDVYGTDQDTLIVFKPHRGSAPKFAASLYGRAFVASMAVLGFTCVVEAGKLYFKRPKGA